MKVLITTPYLPYPLNNGGLIRVHHLVVNIAQRHDVTLLCMEPDNTEQADGIDVLKSKNVSVETVPVARNQKKSNKRFYQFLSLFSNKTYQYFQYHSDDMQNRIDSLCEANSYDLILAEFSQMGYYRFPKEITKYVDQHNVEYEIMQRTFETEKSPLRKLLAKSEFKKYYRQEIENCEKFDGCLTTSQRDADILKDRMQSDTRFHVIPNGVDSEFFQRIDVQQDPNLILFTGTISYYPNVEGILWFTKNVWPLIKQKRMRDYYARATVVVVPLRVGGGTRLKILEAMAMEKAIVSTGVGAEGIDYTNNKDILIEDEPEAFADATIKVMDSEDLKSTLQTHGRVLVERLYDWKAVTGNLCDIFEGNTAVTDIRKAS